MQMSTFHFFKGYIVKDMVENRAWVFVVVDNEVKRNVVIK
jgi:hypothetical protein